MAHGGAGRSGVLVQVSRGLCLISLVFAVDDIASTRPQLNSGEPGSSCGSFVFGRGRRTSTHLPRSCLNRAGASATIPDAAPGRAAASDSSGPRFIMYGSIP